jgi:uncharacterized SAM-binding protein YcdF (DUF218 family)
LGSTTAPIRLRRYLVDFDVWHAALVSLVVLLASGGLVWLGYLLHVLRTAYRSPLQPPGRMVVLVFGRRLKHDEPESDYRHRLARALALARSQLAERLLLLGGRSGGSTITEAAAGHRWLQQQELSERVPVQLEHESTDSLENLRQARRLLQGDALSCEMPSVALVSSRYHLARCQLLARRLGLQGVLVAAEPRLSWSPRQLGMLVLESAYVMCIDVGLRWAQLIGYRRMAARIS